MKKIMFNDRYGLTAAVLQGRKTMTRRIVPTQYVPMIEDGLQGAALIESIQHGHAYKFYDVLAVAQSYKDVINTGYDLIEKRNLRKKLENELSLITLEYAKGWSNKMFVRADLMPHQIMITGVRIERIQDITDEDCLKEGVIKQAHPFVKEAKNVYVCPNLEGYYTHPRDCFATLINRPGVGRKDLWEENPFVFAYSFKIIK